MRALVGLGLTLALAVPSSGQTPAASSTAGERDRALEKAAADAAAGRRSVAAQELREAALRFHSVTALLQLARLEAGQKEGARALATLRQALALAPNSEDLLSAYAQVALASGAPVRAIPALESLTRIWADVADHHYLLGVALMQAGDMTAAVDALAEAERLEPNRVLTLVALGLAFNKRKLYAEAKPYLVRSLEREPESVEAVAALAESEEGLGELDEARAHALRAVARSPDQPTANLVLGMVLMKEEKFAEARDALEKAAAADPTSAKAHYQLSLAYARLGDEARSRREVELYQKALREVEERLQELRGQAGSAPAAPRP
ncbi:MAG: hypothetical protein DMF80_08500 [Acidobacteria bacterium]|nr:MAG: hypothetical protein DMF80_08500 [Acidobacteriota bacterium]